MLSGNVHKSTNGPVPLADVQEVAEAFHLSHFRMNAWRSTPGVVLRIDPCRVTPAANNASAGMSTTRATFRGCGAVGWVRVGALIALFKASKMDGAACI